MSTLEVHPAYRGLFRRLGLTTAADFLRLEGAVIGGHPDRHVLRLTLDQQSTQYAVRSTQQYATQQQATPIHHGRQYVTPEPVTQPILPAATHGATQWRLDRPEPDAAYCVLGTEYASSPNESDPTNPPLPVFLKKEHRVTWRTRLGHAWEGWGWVARSTREGRILRLAERAGVACPQALAWGEAEGRAFLLVREETGLVDLRQHLESHPAQRREIAAALAREVARMHEAGFYHRELCSKHVLVGRDHAGFRFCFLDWQQARHTRRLSWDQRLNDLAMLEATLAAALATAGDRLAFWRAYLRCQSGAVRGPKRLMRSLCRRSAALRRKRRIRELHERPLPPGQQHLIWLDGEGLCVTRSLLDALPVVPGWLETPAPPRSGRRLEFVTIPGPEGRSWRLLRRWRQEPIRWLWSWLHRATFPAPEFEHAAAIIRLERYGVEAPRLLAVGHRTLRPWQKYSFLLLEPPQGTVSLLHYLKHAGLKQRFALLGEAGRMLRRIHEAGYGWKGRSLEAWAVHPQTQALALSGVEQLQRRGGAPSRTARRDFARLLGFPLAGVSGADRLRFFLGYFGQAELSPNLRKTLAQLVKRWQRRRRTLSESRVA